MSKEIYLIEEGWIDPMENRDATGYTIYGYVESEDEAKKFCESKGYWTHKDCWAIGLLNKGEVMPKYRYKKIEPVSTKKFKDKIKVEKKEIKIDLTKLKADWLIEKFHEISDDLMNGETIDEVEITIENNKLYCYFEIDCNRSGTWDGYITINEKGVVKVSLDDTPIEACGIENKLAEEIKKIIIED